MALIELGEELLADAVEFCELFVRLRYGTQHDTA